MAIVRKFTVGEVPDGGTSKENACDTHNQMLARIRTMWAMTGPLRRVELFFVGDSLSALNGGLTDRSSAWWAMVLYNLAVTIKGRGRRGVGTSTSGAFGGNGAAYGMTNPDRMQADGYAIYASAKERYSPVAIMSVQTNDSYNNDNGQNDAITTVANLELWFLAMLPFGLCHLVIEGGGPSSSGGDSAIRTRGVCNAYRALADKYRGLITFIDNSQILAANAVAYTADGGGGQFGSMMYDELHPSGHGRFRMGMYTTGPALLKLCGTRSRLLGWVGDRYDAMLNSRGPLMGLSTRYAGFQVPIPAELTTDNGTFAIEQSDVPDPLALAEGRPDILARRLRFSGIPAKAGSLSISRIEQNPAGYDPTKIAFMPEANLYCDVTNMRAPGFGWVSGGVGGQNRRPDENPDSDIIPHLKGQMTFYAGEAGTEGQNYGNRSTVLSFGWGAGREVAGDIILISASDYAQPPLPPATAGTQLIIPSEDDEQQFSVSEMAGPQQALLTRQRQNPSSS